MRFKVVLSPIPPFLFRVLPDVTWAESLTERTFHGNEVRLMICPRAKRSAWNTKRGALWKCWADSAEQSLPLVHRNPFIKTVCGGKIQCDVSLFGWGSTLHTWKWHIPVRYEVHLCLKHVFAQRFFHCFSSLLYIHLLCTVLNICLHRPLIYWFKLTETSLFQIPQLFFKLTLMYPNRVLPESCICIPWMMSPPSVGHLYMHCFAENADIGFLCHLKVSRMSQNRFYF